MSSASGLRFTYVQRYRSVQFTQKLVSRDMDERGDYQPT